MNQKLKTKSDVFFFLKKVSKQIPRGELLFKNDENNGKIYIHEGKVAWAFATGQTESFQSILLKDLKIPKDTLVEGINKSREAGKKHLSDILLTIGIDDEEKRKDIILKHSRVAISTMTSWPSCTVQITKSDDPEEELDIAFELEELLPEVETQAEPASIEEMLEILGNKIDGFNAAAIVEVEAGCPIALRTNVEELDIDTASAFYRNVAKSAHEALVALGKAEESANPILEILITGTNENVVLRILNEGKQVLYLLLEAQANPGQALVEIRKRVPTLEKLLSEF